MFAYSGYVDVQQERMVPEPIPHIPAITGRHFEATIDLAIRAASETAGPVMMIFADIAVQVDPGDDAATIARNYDETAALVLVRLEAMPRVSEKAPVPGSIIETLVDDHSTKTMKGSAGIVTDVESDGGRVVHKIVVRFARRTVDYVPEDFHELRFVR